MHELSTAPNQHMSDQMLLTKCETTEWTITQK